MKSNILISITAITLLAFPGVSQAQAPSLGTAAGFVLFSSVGAVSNSGISHLTGNVGTNSGLSTGFGNVDGVMHDNDGASAQCAADLQSAYNQLNSMVPTFFPAPLLGNGQVLNAGVYLISAPATLNLDLILDGQGNASAVFVFQIQGAFSTNPASKVKLINGALACNVFWKVEGLVSMAVATTMRGNVIANNAAINMNSGDTLEGRALSTTGAVTVDGVLAFMPIGCGSLVLTGPSAPSLASIACYTLFSSDGPVTNVGVTYVIGDIGTNNGSATGFNPLFVTGAIHGTPDGSTAAGAADLNAAYIYLNTLPYDIELLYPAQFGNNLVLTPHTYLMNAAATFTDTLYLNAQGNTNAVFVIQINGAIVTSTYSKVVLLNGARSENVYWQINGATDINDYSIFKGTIICNNGAISLNTGVMLEGRALTTTGALNTSAINAVMPLGCPGVSAPVIITEPTNQFACLGDSASFTVTATGTGLTYQWRKGNISLINAGNISGANTATLLIYPVTLADAAPDYNVIVAGAYAPADTSINVSLVISTVPNIITQPVDQIVCEGDPASFSVVAVGAGLSYQWRRGTVNLVNSGNISGATTSTLMISPVTQADAANDYNVLVTGCPPADSSVNVFLIVNDSTIIITEATAQIVCEGDSSGFTIAATGTSLTYQWRKGNVNLLNAGNISGVNTPVLVIDPVNAADAAPDYNVIVSGACQPNDTSLNVSLTVNEFPVITTEPVSQIVCEGNSAVFSVVASGTALVYQWRKGTVSLVNSGNISGVTTATLMINPAGLTDAATDYNVMVTGICSPADSSVYVSLAVNATPVATAGSNSPVCTGDSLLLTAQTVAGATYNWSGPNGFTASTQNPAIFPASPVNTGTYSLTLTTNGCSSATSTAAVSVGTCVADLSIIKTVNDTTPAISSNVVFTITITNNGPGDATGVEVTDNLQNGYAYVSSSATTGAYNASTGVWTIGSLVNGASAILTITVTVVPNGNYVNTAIVYGNGTDPVMSNNNSSVETYPTDFHIPNAFSPNGDGTNDFFVIRGIENYPANTFIIFNRWGNKVYQASPYQNVWDGSLTEGRSVGGDKLPVGTYFYVLDLGDGSPVYKGTIYLNK